MTIREVLSSVIKTEVICTAEPPIEDDYLLHVLASPVLGETEPSDYDVGTFLEHSARCAHCNSAIVKLSKYTIALELNLMYEAVGLPPFAQFEVVNGCMTIHRNLDHEIGFDSSSASIN